MKMSDFGYNWFDLAVVLVIAVGILRGRSRGMSQELLDVFKWLAIVVVGSLIYQPGGKLLAGYTYLDLAVAYVVVYLGVLILLRFFFGWIQRLIGEKLVAGDVFGNGEYYLGMMAGAVRFACYVLVGMALLSAHYVSAEELAAQAKLQKDNFGDISFPTIGTLQQTILHGSASGQFVQRYLAHELITPAPPEKSAAPRDTIARQRERAINEVLGDTSARK